MHMTRGRPNHRLSITVDPDLHHVLVAAAEGEGISESEWVARAAERALKIKDGLQACAEYEAEFGAFTEAEMAEAREFLFGPLPDAS